MSEKLVSLSKASESIEAFLSELVEIDSTTGKECKDKLLFKILSYFISEIVMGIAKICIKLNLTKFFVKFKRKF